MLRSGDKILTSKSELGTRLWGDGGPGRAQPDVCPCGSGW